MIGLTLTHRRSHDLLERRTLVRVAAGGEPYQATAGDWLPAGLLSGRLPDGEPYGVSIFDLRPGLELAPSGLWINGDRRQETLAAHLTWRGRFGGRWWTRGHLSWSDRRWRLGPDFLHFDDPTDTAGSGDDDGDHVVDSARESLGTAELAIDSRWSFHCGAGVELPWAFDLGIAVAGREGYPLPYFRRVARERAGIANVELTDRVDAIRAPDLVTLDVRLAKQLTFGDLGVTLGLEAFNLLGAGDVLRRELDLGVGRGGNLHEVTAPRVWRLGVRLGWR